MQVAQNKDHSLNSSIIIQMMIKLIHVIASDSLFFKWLLSSHVHFKYLVTEVLISFCGSALVLHVSALPFSFFYGTGGIKLFEAQRMHPMSKVASK